MTLNTTVSLAMRPLPPGLDHRQDTLAILGIISAATYLQNGSNRSGISKLCFEKVRTFCLLGSNSNTAFSGLRRVDLPGGLGTCHCKWRHLGIFFFHFARFVIPLRCPFLLSCDNFVLKTAL